VTGDIIKIHIKTFEALKGARASVYVNDRHIGYWKRFCVPVILCCVDLSRKQVYWKQITVTESVSLKRKIAKGGVLPER
jgi:hypothetical protein